MNKDFLISVIIPIYKVEQYLKMCVNSIISQTYQKLEIILVDDGSPDRSGEICDEFAKRDSRIIVIHKENGGLSDARNSGIDVASGDYLMFIDGDDYIAEDMCEKLYTAIEDNHADISICNFKYVGEDLSDDFCTMNENMPICNEVITGRTVIEDKILQEQSWYWIVAVNKLYRRDLFNCLRFPKGKVHEDEFVFHKVFMQCERVACISDALYFYVQRDNSIMNSSFRIQSLDSCEALFERANELIKREYSHASIYSAAVSGIGRLSQIFTYDLAKNNIIQLRYQQLLSQYRKIGLRRLMSNIDGVGHRLAILLAYISPYILWRLQRVRKHLI